MRRPIPPTPRPVLLALSVLACTSALAQGSPPAAPSAAPAQVQLAPLPDSEQFSQNVDLRTRPAGESLDALIQALARSVGLSAINQGIPEGTVGRYDLGEPKPFREVWDIVLTLNGLEYVLRGDNIVVVGPPEVLTNLQPQQNKAKPSVSVTYTVNSPPSQLQTLLESQFPTGSGVAVAAFEELGLLTVRGTTMQQARVQETLERFDRSEVVKVRRIYPLSYARASNLAGVLLGTLFSTNTLGSSEQRTVSDLCSADGSPSEAAASTSTDASTDTSGEASNGEAQSLSISADPRTNRLIVTAPVKTQEEIEGLIKTLDQPERQVNVQVRIQEVSTDVDERLGINLTSALGNFSTTLFGADTSEGLSFVFDAQKAITGFNLGAVLDAYERQGLARKVDDSNLTVLNNGVATLQAGGTNYAYITNADGDVEQFTVPYGVIVGFTPQITNNDEVILDVCARVDVPQQRDDLGRVTEFTSRKANSRVTIKPGQTIALGGLLQNQLSDSTRKVPGLGSVPVIGNLFTTNAKVETNTELLVIVTANVLE